jgi:hypothetical protein
MSGRTPVYGDRDAAINRRGLLAGLAALAAGPAAAQLPFRPEAAPRLRYLAWTGEARILEGAREIAIGVRTRIEPFVRARSESWLLDRPDQVRVMEIEPDGGRIVRDGRSTPMPPAQWRHERQQFGAWGYLALQAPQVARWSRGARFQQPGFPPATLELADPLAAPYPALTIRVDAPDGHGHIDERFTMEGRAPSPNGMRWPRVVRIAQDGRPWLVLEIAEVTSARA